jgi:hydrogenase 3 maturation protease
MSKSSWREQLDQKLAKAAKKKNLSNSSPGQTLKVALVGVGSELNGDDAAGNQIALQLMERADLPAHFIAVNAGSIPENASGTLRRFHPDLVIFVDAADFGDVPGEICWLEEEQITGMSASSHTLPLSILGGYLREELHCQIEYLGIQPLQIEFGEPPSTPIQRAIQEIVSALLDRFNQKEHPQK